MLGSTALSLTSTLFKKRHMSTFIDVVWQHPHKSPIHTTHLRFIAIANHRHLLICSYIDYDNNLFRTFFI